MGEAAILSDRQNIHIAGRAKHFPRVVNICCLQCKKRYRLSYTEEGSPDIIAFRNLDFTCSRCKRNKHVDSITEGALLSHVTAWNAVYI